MRRKIVKGVDDDGVDLRCVFCGDQGKAASKVRGKWVCGDCLDALYEHFKSHLFVSKLMAMSREMEQLMREELRGAK